MFKKKLRSITWFVIGICMLLLQIRPVFAQEDTQIHIDFPVGIIQEEPDNKWAVGFTQATNTGYHYAFYSKMSINGRKVYCIEPLVAAEDGKGGYIAADLSSYVGNVQTSRKLEWISALGYGFQGDTSMEMDFATQVRIWQELTPGLVTHIHPEIQSKIDLINARLKVMYTEVSFKGQTIVLNGYGKEFAKTITDTNNV